MSTDFPSLKALGVSIEQASRHSLLCSYQTVDAELAEKLASELLALRREIEEAPAVYGYHRSKTFYSFDEQPSTTCTHTARLIRVKPIEKPDTPASVLARLLRAPNAFIQAFGVTEYERAKKLLEKTK